MRNIVFAVVLLAAAVLAIIHFDQIIAGLGVIVSALKPLLYGGVMAYLINLIMQRLERLPFLKKGGILGKARRPLCIVLALATVAAVVVITVVMAAPQLKDSITAVGRGLATAWAAMIAFIEPLDLEGMLMQLTGGKTPDWDQIINDIVAWVGGFDGLVSSAVGMGGGVFRTAVDLGLGLVFAVYLLMAKERVCAGARTLSRTVLPAAWDERVTRAVATVNDCFSRFISGQCLEAVILGGLCAAGMFILRLPHAFTVGLIVGISALVPIFGAWIGGIVGALMILPTSFEQAVVFVVYLVVLQQIENHFIYPRTMGNATGVSSIWVMAAVVVGGALNGIVGMMLSVPLVATATQLLKGFWKHKAAEAEASASAA